MSPPALPTDDDSFPDMFSLHLAIELLGNTKVLDHLHCLVAADTPIAASNLLYWRSKLFLSDPSSCMLMGDLDAAIPFPQVLFVDITFDFVKRELLHTPGSSENIDTSSTTTATWSKEEDTASKSHVLASWGALLVVVVMDHHGAKKTEAQYIATQSLSGEQLRLHITALQLDPQTVTAESLATAMAEELLRQPGPSTSSTTNGNNNNNNNTMMTVHNSLSSSSSVDVTIPYQAMGPRTNGTFTLTRDDARCTTFDAASMRFLYWDLVQNNHCGRAKEEEPSSQSRNAETKKRGRGALPLPVVATKEQVLSAFEHWKKHPLRKKHLLPSKGIFGLSPQTVSNCVVAAPTAASTRPLAARRKLKGMGAFGGRRKRQKGLVYEDDSDSD